MNLQDDRSSELAGSLLDTLYGAITEPERWRVFLQLASEQLRADKAMLLSYSPMAARTSVWAHLNFTEELRRLLEEKTKFNPWVDEVRKHESEGWYAGVIEDDLPGDFRRSKFYEESYRRHEIEWIATAMVFVPGNQIPGLAVTRHAGQPPFSLDDKELLRSLGPHLRRVFQAMRSFEILRDCQAATESALELSGAACLILDGGGQVLSVNRRAEALLEGPGALRLRNGRLCCSLGQEQPALDAVVRRACGWQPQALEAGGEGVSVHSSTGAPLYVSVLPHRGGPTASPKGSPAALVFLTTPEEQAGGEHRLWQSIFGLSPAECRVAEMMMRGLEVAQIALAAHIKPDTVRYYQKSIYRKAGVRGQGALLHLLSRLPCRPAL